MDLISGESSKVLRKQGFRSLKLMSVDMEQELGNEPEPFGADYGRLDNGLVYYVRRNSKPRMRAALALAVKVGSVLEDEDQRGVAHIVEHLAFSATTKYTNHDIVKFLESIGAEFGPCQNAMTTADETIYELFVPVDKPELLSQAISILAEFSSEIRVSKEDLEKERGAVMEEYRGNRNATGRMQDSHWQLMMEGSKYAERLPIGLEKVIRSVPAATVKKFYQKWYHLCNMAVVAVGDFPDTKTVVDLIKTHFEDKRSSSNPPEIPFFPVPSHEDTRFSCFVESEAAGSAVMISYKMPVSDLKTVKDYRDMLAESMFLHALNQRLFKISRRKDPPFFACSVAADVLVSPLKAYIMSSSCKEKGTLASLESMLLEVARVRLHGFSDREISVVRALMMSEIESAYLERDQIQSTSLRDEYIQHFLHKEPVIGIEYEAQLQKSLLPQISASDVSRYSEKLRTSCGCVIKTMEPRSAATVDDMRNVVSKVNLQTTEHSTKLHMCHPCRRTIPYRIYAVVHMCGIIALMYHHAHSLFTEHTALLTSLLLISDVVLASMWASATSLRLNPVHRTEYPEKYVAKPEEHFPKLDVFICTADPYKEPPMMVANTVLSVMAYGYPSDKISVYVSDDGGSSLTLFALMEAAKFSEHWLPFCKKNNVQDRSPEVYFSLKSSSWTEEAENLKKMYEDVKDRVEHVVDIGKVDQDQFRDVFDLWDHKFTPQDHPSIIKVLQNNETEITPNLIYVSREKIRATPHHFKAGALNTLLRVSSVMTNSPIILTLDCDMYSNNPTTPLHALCYLSDPMINFGLGFVQFPQRFQGINRNDVYASELIRPFDINMVGYDGLMGPIHVGTGCFFNRRIFYGPPTNLILPELDELAPTRIADKPIKAHTVLALAHNVAGCNYEHNTNWGSKIGFRYGSLVEDYYTGFMLHCEGWRSMFCRPQRAAFYGSTPKRLTDVVWQQMRWSIGLLEMGFSRYSPFTYGLKSLGLFTGLGYCYYVVWPFCSIPLTVYGVLPQLALIYGIRVFPKPSDQWFWLYIFLSLGAYVQDLSDFLLEGGTCRKWWNDQRMWLIRGLSSFFFGMIEYTLKTLNLSTPGFNVTSKANGDDEQKKRYGQEIFDFAPSSSIFLPMTTVAVLNLFAFVSGLYGLFAWGEGLSLELMLASFVVVNSLPIYEAMVLRKDDGKLQKGICFLAGILTLVLILGGYFLLK